MNEDLNHLPIRAPRLPAPLTPEARAALASQRAEAVDAWRAYVESGAVLHRQRSEFLERQFLLALKRERRAGEEVSRLEGIVRDLDAANRELVGQVSQLQVALDTVTPAQAMRRNLRKMLERSPIGRRLLVVVRQLLNRAPPMPDNEAEGAAKAPVSVAQQESVDGAASDSAVHSLVHLHPGGRAADASRATVLVVCLHAENTALGRYSLDLIDSFAQYRNVVVWHLGDGPLLSEFQAAACFFTANSDAGHDYALARAFAHELLTLRPEIECAFVIGGELKTPLPALAEKYLPIIGIVDEQIVHASSLYAFEEILFWHTHTVFTNHAASEAVQRLYPYFNMERSTVLVPGPGVRSLPHLLESEDSRAKVFSPWICESASEGFFIVGWGPATHEAGLDLFIACADVMLREPLLKPCKFLWLVQDAPDLSESSVLRSAEQQIQRLGLQESVGFVHAPLSESLPLTQVDLIILPARSDFLQHRAGQALLVGTPVLAFDAATVISDVIDREGLSDICLARYGDAQDLAGKALSLLRKPAALCALKQRLKSVDWHALTLDAHVEKLLALGRREEALCRQERDDAAVIHSADALRPDYMGHVIDHADEAGSSWERLYVRGWKAGIGSRKPRPGFLPQLYAACRMDSGSIEDPFAHYLRSGSPVGPWIQPVIGPAAAGATLEKFTLRVALHIHAYYPEMLEELLERLAQNEHRPDLFISVKDDASMATAASILKAYPGKVVALESVPNRGRDIGPFLTTFGPRLVSEYDLIGHLHTKASPHAGHHIVERWRHFLLENLVGGAASGSMMDTILAKLAEHPEWGIVFPDDPIPFGWDTNRPCASALARHLIPGELPDHFCFPVGTMFWIRAAALKPFVDLGLTYDDYPPEPLPVDGSLLHALERLFGVVPPALGMVCAVTSTPEVSR